LLTCFSPLSASYSLFAQSADEQYKTVAPLGDRVFVKVDEAEATSAGGILLPSAAQVKSTQGVIAAAPKGGAKTLSEGDRVLYSKYAGTEIKMGKDEFVLLKVRTWFGGVGGRKEGGESNELPVPDLEFGFVYSFHRSSTSTTATATATNTAARPFPSTAYRLPLPSNQLGLTRKPLSASSNNKIFNFPPTKNQKFQEDDVIGKMNGSDVGKMSPLGDRVLLKALEAKKETDGGVILATEESERPTLGKVRGRRASERERGRLGEREGERDKERKKGMTKFALRVGFSFPSHRSNGSSGLKTPRVGGRGL